MHTMVAALYRDDPETISPFQSSNACLECINVPIYRLCASVTLHVHAACKSLLVALCLSARVLRFQSSFCYK